MLFPAEVLSCGDAGDVPGVEFVGEFQGDTKDVFVDFEYPKGSVVGGVFQSDELKYWDHGTSFQTWILYVPFERTTAPTVGLEAWMWVSEVVPVWAKRMSSGRV